MDYHSIEEKNSGLEFKGERRVWSDKVRFGR